MTLVCFHVCIPTGHHFASCDNFFFKSHYKVWPRSHLSDLQQGRAQCSWYCRLHSWQAGGKMWQRSCGRHVVVIWRHKILDLLKIWCRQLWPDFCRDKRDTVIAMTDLLVCWRGLTFRWRVWRDVSWCAASRRLCYVSETWQRGCHAWRDSARLCFVWNDVAMFYLRPQCLNQYWSFVAVFCSLIARRKPKNTDFLEKKYSPINCLIPQEALECGGIF